MTKKEYPKAIELFDKGAELERQNGNTRTLAIIHLNLANVYVLQQIDFEGQEKSQPFKLRALENYHKALSISKTLGDVYLQSVIYANRGKVYLTDNEFEKAMKDLQDAERIATEIGDATTIMNVADGLYRVYKKLGKHQLALTYHEKLQKLNDSIYLEQNKNEFKELQTRYDVKLKEMEKTELLRKTTVQELSIKNQRLVIFIISALALLVIALIFFTVRQKKLRAETTSVLLEQRLLRSQMNPHFLFNSLTNIESFIYDHQPKEAGIYLSKFSRLMRLILENSSNDYISMSKEIETLEYYLSLQQLRLNDSFEYSISDHIHPRTMKFQDPRNRASHTFLVINQ